LGERPGPGDQTTAPRRLQENVFNNSARRGWHRPTPVSGSCRCVVGSLSRKVSCCNTVKCERAVRQNSASVQLRRICRPCTHGRSSLSSGPGQGSKCQARPASSSRAGVRVVRRRRPFSVPPAVYRGRMAIMEGSGIRGKMHGTASLTRPGNSDVCTPVVDSAAVRCPLARQRAGSARRSCG
jgi:hypothetical protein